jgi:predicted ATP-grasp superfamily ATP-dependent carboligase
VCASSGILTPRTWFPAGDDELAAIAKNASFPLIVKPRSQVLLSTMRKGRVVSSRDELAAAYVDFSRSHRHDSVLLRQRPELGQPMIQQFFAADHDSIYSVSGFSDYRHGLFVCRGAFKLAQWPRHAGVGIYFADAPVNTGLAGRIRALCEAARFVGVFEAEFVNDGREPRLIDFNPRFFGQIGFDVARALPSPLFIYLAATDDVARLRAEVDEARAWTRSGEMLYANRMAIAWTRVAERLVGRRSVIRTTHGASTSLARPRVVDAVADWTDWVPSVLDSVQQVAGVLRHPRSVLRAAVRGD